MLKLVIGFKDRMVIPVSVDGVLLTANKYSVFIGSGSLPDTLLVTKLELCGKYRVP